MQDGKTAKQTRVSEISSKPTNGIREQQVDRFSVLEPTEYQKYLEKGRRRKKTHIQTVEKINQPFPKKDASQHFQASCPFPQLLSYFQTVVAKR